MIINATFTGQDGSLGLKNGQTYKLSVVYNGIIMVDNKPLTCKYDSINSFFRNWTNIQVLTF